jgi:hypothetical protein
MAGNRVLPLLSNLCGAIRFEDVARFHAVAPGAPLFARLAHDELAERADLLDEQLVASH